jgi:hypothetical protein
MIGRAMAQAVSPRPLTAEARVQSRVSPCGICGGRSGTRTGFSPSTSGFPCQFHSTGAPLKWKSRRNLICLIGLHNKPSRLRCVRSFCCGALLNKNKKTHVVTRKLIQDFGEEDFSDRSLRRQRIGWENYIMFNMRKSNVNMIEVAPNIIISMVLYQRIGFSLD